MAKSCKYDSKNVSKVVPVCPKKKTGEYNRAQLDLSENAAFLSHFFHTVQSGKGITFEARARKELEQRYPTVSESDSLNRFQEVFPEFFDVPFLGPLVPKFTFIDLFAGIGGFRLAMQNLGGKCIFSSEWNEKAQQTYLLNYGEVPFGDITKKETKDAIPDGIDVVCAGFPCQAFSLAGTRMGFEDNYKGMSRGTLFRDVVEICEKHRPKAIFCENVKGLTIHDKGKTFKIIKGAFAELGYHVYSQILNSRNFGVPQNRERIYIVAFRDDIDSSEFSFPEPTDSSKCIRDIMEKNPVPAKYYLSDVYLETLIQHRKRHEAKGNGFGYEIRDLDGVAGAIVCGGMGRERNLIIDKRQHDLTPTTHIKGAINTQGIRKMTPREWARLQGYPENFVLGVADVHLYTQFGNSVSVPVIQAVGRQIFKVLFK